MLDKSDNNDTDDLIQAELKRAYQAINEKSEQVNLLQEALQ